MKKKRDKDIIIIVCYTSYPILDYSICITKKKKSLPEYRRHYIIEVLFSIYSTKIVGDCISFPQYTVLSLLYTHTQQTDLQEGGELNLYMFSYRMKKKKLIVLVLKLMQFILSQKFTKFSQKENFKLILQLCCGLSVKLMCSCLIKKLNIIEKKVSFFGFNLKCCNYFTKFLIKFN